MSGASRHLAVGAALLAVGLGATLAMDGQVLWWGAILAGLFELGRGAWVALRGSQE